MSKEAMQTVESELYNNEETDESIEALARRLVEKEFKGDTALEQGFKDLILRYKDDLPEDDRTPDRLEALKVFIKLYQTIKESPLILGSQDDMAIVELMAKMLDHVVPQLKERLDFNRDSVPKLIEHLIILIGFSEKSVHSRYNEELKTTDTNTPEGQQRLVELHQEVASERLFAQKPIEFFSEAATLIFDVNASIR